MAEGVAKIKGVVLASLGDGERGDLVGDGRRVGVIDKI